MITDSASDLLQGYPNVDIIPMQIRFGDQTYEDGVNLSHEQFYEKLESEQDFPTTSQVTPFAWEKAFQNALQSNDYVIAVTISSKLSGTYQSAVIAAQEFADKVFVVDSYNVSAAERILVMYGLQLIEQGKDVHEIVEILNKEKDNLEIVAALDTLEYLKKGGRISATTAFAGGIIIH